MIPYTENRGLYINGEWVMPASGASEPVINPATEDVIGMAPEGGPPEIEAALAAARTAFEVGPWPRMTMAERIAVIEAFIANLESKAEAIQELIVAEVGCIKSLSQGGQFEAPLVHARYAIEEARKLKPEAVPLEAGPFAVGGGQVMLEPAGVVAAITPYNFPFQLNVVKVVPALLMGNTCVLKPSPYTPFQALVCGIAAEEVGLPPGVLNIVTGGVVVGEALTSDPRVDLVSFTGSDTVGASIMAQGAPTLKRMLLELGGKSAQIVLEDADVQRSAYAGFQAFTTNAGQGCGCLTRHIVHNSIRQQYVETLQGIGQSVVVGNPIDPATTMGPVISEKQRDRVEHYVQVGHDSGASLVLGGQRPPHLERGYFYEPTVFDNVDNSSAIAQDEIFGPVCCVIGFDTHEEAVNLANDSAFGLTGAVFSADPKRSYELGLQMRTGGVWVNGGAGKLLSTLPFGGYKRAGIGREYGSGWLAEYAEQKAISFHLG